MSTFYFRNITPLEGLQCSCRKFEDIKKKIFVLFFILDVIFVRIRNKKKFLVAKYFSSLCFSLFFETFYGTN